jgi:hypothetical protein
LLVRSLLIWLMVLVLPGHGLAASVMQHCAPADPPVHSAATVAWSMDGTDHVHALELPEHDPARAVHGSEVLATDGMNFAHGESAEGAGQCNACAACCPAIGMPPSVSPIPTPPAETRTLQLPFMEVESFVPGGLDRPPRTPLA